MPIQTDANKLVREDIAAVNFHFHSRYRVYPQNISNTITLAAAAPANTFGAWTQIIPLNTIPFIIMVVGIVVEAADAATAYLIQIGYNTVDSDPGANMILGERRLRLPTPINQATELLHIDAQSAPANSKIWGRLKSATAVADELEVSIVLTRHIGVSEDIALYPTFPW